MRRVEPGPGQESVWDYPRPPRLERSDRHVVVELEGITIADTTRSLRILETSHPPVFYIPQADIVAHALLRVARTTWCEFKGVANYFTVVAGGRTEPDAAWTYLRPMTGYEPLVGHVAFYPGRMDACILGEELVHAQPGDFYGGWLTEDIAGPVKGAPGTLGW